MTFSALPAPRFVRRTTLAPGEYRKYFRQIDREVIEVVTSREADRITPLMSKIYLRLANAPDQYWEREGVLRFMAEPGAGRRATAWALLCEVAGVSSATASKALRWLHEQGIIGYFAGKNGVGLRIFLNRAATSIGVRPGGQKILAWRAASSHEAPASRDEAAFKDSFAVLEDLETCKSSRAPKNGAEPELVSKSCSESTLPKAIVPCPSNTTRGAFSQDNSKPLPLEQIVTRLRAELEPVLCEATRRAAAREQERTREWFESRGLPKAARVAQHEAFNLLKKFGLVKGSGNNVSAKSEAGRGTYTPSDPHPVSGVEVNDLAQACVAMFEAQGQSIEQTVSEMSAEGGGFLLPADAAKVRERAEALLQAGCDVRGM